MSEESSVSVSSLIGSQLETYQTLISMGFSKSDSVSVAQIFGSNVEGAINCVLTGGVANLTMENPVPLPLHPLPRIPLYTPNKLNKYRSFRITSISYKLMTGYIREQHNQDNIPTVIKDIIIRYFNFYFIRLNYNIKNIKPESTLKNESKIYVLKENKTLRSIAIELESNCKYNYNQLEQLMGHVNTTYYSYFIHLWINYNYLKHIYPVDNKNMKITMDQIINTNNNRNNKWVEIPNDFEQVTIYDIDQLIIQQDKKILELGIERFDIHNNQWPFRNNKLTPFEHEISDKFKPKQTLFPLKTSKPSKLLSSPDIDTFVNKLQSKHRSKSAPDINSLLLPTNAEINKNDSTNNSMDDMPSFPVELVFPGFIPTTQTTLESIKTKQNQTSMGTSEQNEYKMSNEYNMKWTEYLEIGDIIDAKDEQDKWYESVIRYIENKNNKKLLYIHYIGWNKKWDEIIDAYDYKRISKRNTKTIRAYMPKISKYSCKPEIAYPNFPKSETLNDKHKPTVQKSDIFSMFRMFGADDQQ